MTNQEIAQVFIRLAELLELLDENPFKIRSYRAAAQTIEDTAKSLAEIVKEGGAAKLRELPGIGEAISRKIVDLLTTGTFKRFEEVKAQIPETVLDLLQIEGIGLKTLQILYRQFQITNLNDFAKFVAGGGLESVPRMNVTTQKRIRESLNRLGY
ncbi:MAG: helix-hairpin-helix domain-containing protein [Acidobacteria bacterium]|nr:helix-hairpin-helix domain-containing protein [Acidobacteriota bacterium]